MQMFRFNSHSFIGYLRCAKASTRNRIHNMDPPLLYAAPKLRRAKGLLPDHVPGTAPGFTTVPLPGSGEQPIELRFQ